VVDASSLFGTQQQCGKAAHLAASASAYSHNKLNRHGLHLIQTHTYTSQGKLNRSSAVVADASSLLGTQQQCGRAPCVAAPASVQS